MPCVRWRSRIRFCSGSAIAATLGCATGGLRKAPGASHCRAGCPIRSSPGATPPADRGPIPAQPPQGGGEARVGPRPRCASSGLDTKKQLFVSPIVPRASRTHGTTPVPPARIVQTFPASATSVSASLGGPHHRNPRLQRALQARGGQRSEGGRRADCRNLNCYGCAFTFDRWNTGAGAVGYGCP